MYFVDRSAVVLKPTEAFLQWLLAADPDMPQLTLKQLRSNCTTYLIPEFELPEAAISYMDERYREVFEAELAGWEIEKARWPQDMSLKKFWEFFELEIHDMVLDMEDDDIMVSPVPEAPAAPHD